MFGQGMPTLLCPIQYANILLDSSRMVGFDIRFRNQVQFSLIVLYFGIFIDWFKIEAILFIQCSKQACRAMKVLQSHIDYDNCTYNRSLTLFRSIVVFIITDKYSAKYSLHSVWMMEYSTKYYQSHTTLLWILIMLRLAHKPIIIIIIRLLKICCALLALVRISLQPPWCRFPYSLSLSLSLIPKP